MSEERIPNHIIIVNNCPVKGQKRTRIELFRAKQWRSRWRPYKRNVNPTPPANDQEWWYNNYRARVNGRWYRSTAFKFNFYSMREIADMVERNLF